MDLATKAGKYVMYVLAVAGGFMVGNVLTLIICRLLAKFALKQSINERLERLLRVMGGLIVAVLVAYLLFKFGTGWGLGGSGTGEGQDTGGQTPGTDNTPKEKTPAKADSKTKEEETILATSLRVTVQKATDYPKSFRFEGEAEGVDLVAAKEKLKTLRDRSERKLQLLELRVYKDSTEAGHPDVREFMDYANQLGIHTRVEKLGNRPE
jgi:hypothetical protein